VLPPAFLVLGAGLLILSLTALARRLPVPTPILQLAAGLLVGVVSGRDFAALDPELVFFVFLPPILWLAAYLTSWRDFKANLRPIGLLAVGLVVATALAVAAVSHLLLPGIPWAVAVALGAIVAPPDAIAAEAIITRLSVPRRVIAVLAGESLVNDASALVLYRTAVAAAVVGSFSLGETVVRFFIDAGLGVLAGLLVGWLVIRAMRLTRDTLPAVLLNLLGPYLAWLAGELLHASAVLACVAGGLYVRQRFSTAVTPRTRVHSSAVWELFGFVLSALIFLLLGLQLVTLTGALPSGRLGAVVLVGLAISGVAILIRLLWVPVVAWLPRRLSRELRLRDPMPPPAAIFLVAWTSMRGIVSLAAALALPLALLDGSPFPYRAEIILIALVVILVTLVLQGMALEPLIRRFGFPPDATARDEERFARREAVRQGLEKLEDLAHEPWAVDAPAELQRMREEFRERIRQQDGDGNAERAVRLRREVLTAERRALIRLRNEGMISDSVLLKLEHELDQEALRLGAGED
jgi:CPA1 family monovalent cation:H+ antiporter